MGRATCLSLQQNEMRNFSESGSPDKQPVISDELNKLRLYSCVDPRNISFFSRGKAVVDGRTIHIRFVLNKALLEQFFLRANLFHAAQPSTLNCLKHGYRTANDILSNI